MSEEPFLWTLVNASSGKPINPIKIYVREAAALAGAKRNSFRHRPVVAVPLFLAAAPPEPDAREAGPSQEETPR